MLDGEILSLKLPIYMEIIPASLRVLSTPAQLAPPEAPAAP